MTRLNLRYRGRVLNGVRWTRPEFPWSEETQWEDLKPAIKWMHQTDSRPRAIFKGHRLIQKETKPFASGTGAVDGCYIGLIMNNTYWWCAKCRTGGKVAES